jgi:hypothetical protein
MYIYVFTAVDIQTAGSTQFVSTVLLCIAGVLAALLEPQGWAREEWRHQDQ